MCVQRAGFALRELADCALGAQNAKPHTAHINDDSGRLYVEDDAV